MATAESQVTLDPAIWTEPVRGGYPDPRLLGLSGLEQMRAYFRGVAPRPPIHHLTGMIPTEAGPGTSVFLMPATRWLLSPPGFIQLGMLAVLADGPLGCAVQTALPPLTPYTTAEMSMNYARPVDEHSGTLVARGSLVFAGRTLALSEATIEDGRGRIVAHGTSRCYIFPPLGPAPAQAPDLPVVEEPAYDTPDPYLREPAGDTLPQEVYDRLSGLEIFRGHMSGQLPAPPISHLTGLRVVGADDGRAAFVLPATEWLNSPLARVEGGFIALLADIVIASAVQTTVSPGGSYTPLDLKVNFLRPVVPDGRDMKAVGTVVHRGRTIAVANAEVTDGDGRRVAIGTGTVLLREGQPWRSEPKAPPSEGA